MRIAWLAPALILPAFATAALNDQLLDEFRKTKADVSEVRVLAQDPLVVALTGQEDKLDHPPQWAKGELLGVFAHRGEQIVPISILPNTDFPTAVWIKRHGPDFITFGLADPDDRIETDDLKIFFDSRMFLPKRILHFAPVRVRRITAAAGVVTLVGSDGEQDFTARERNGVWTVTAAKAPPQPPVRPPSNLGEIPPMPVSTIGQFEEARPDRARHLSEEEVRQVTEKVGPAEQVGARIWVGKTFYDLNGSLGVGDVGYYDSSTQNWTFLHIPQLADWSASALLVENDLIWVGLVQNGEGIPTPGGLLRYDRAGKTATVLPVLGNIDRIVRAGKQIYCGTSGGFAVVDPPDVKEFHFEPQLNGSYLIVGN